MAKQSKHHYIIAVLKSTMLGAILFAALTIIALIADRLWWHGMNLGLGMVLAFPGFIAWAIMGVQHSTIPHFVRTETFGVIANALFGALVFFVFSNILQFIKGKHK